jgi:hypothetical protein
MRHAIKLTAALLTTVFIGTSAAHALNPQPLPPRSAGSYRVDKMLKPKPVPPSPCISCPGKVGPLRNDIRTR